MEPRFFEGPSAFRAWLKSNHATSCELYVGFHKKHSGRPSLTWPESVAEALCFGWIDGIRRRIDDDRYVIRFTPRRPGSIWSVVNIRLVSQLESAGKMTDAGRAAFARRTAAKSGIYRYEQGKTRTPRLDAAKTRRFKNNKSAWVFFASLPPSHRKKMLLWITSAKTDETKDRRFQRLVDACAARQRLN